MEYKLSKLKNLRNDNSVWVGMDDKELFVKNCKEYPNSKSLKYYKENPIEYSFNNYGFRTPDEFNSIDEGNVFIGDSHTMGNALHLENIWSYKLNKDLGGKFWNLSQGGSGIQSSYRLLGGFKDRLKIKNIYHLALHHPRFEFIYEGNVVKLSPWTIDLLVRNDKVKFDSLENVLDCFLVFVVSLTSSSFSFFLEVVSSTSTSLLTWNVYSHFIFLQDRLFY